MLPQPNYACFEAGRGSSSIPTICVVRVAFTTHPTFVAQTAVFVVWLWRLMRLVGDLAFLPFFGPLSLLSFTVKRPKNFRYREVRKVVPTADSPFPGIKGGD